MTDKKYKKILIWEQNWIGDVLFSTPFIKAVRKKFKDAYIAVIARPSVREVLENNPGINAQILFDDKNEGILGKIKFIGRLRREKFDTVFLLHRSLSKALAAFFAGIPRRIGHFYKKRNFILTDIVKIKNPDINKTHKIEYFLALAEYAGCDIRDKSLEFVLTGKDEEYIDALLKENHVEKDEPFVVLNQGANWPLKRWPEEYFARLADELIKKYKLKIVVTGSGADITRMLRIQDLSSNKLVILPGKTSLKELGALFKKSKAVVSADSGPLHIARAVKANCVAIFGPTSPELTGPYGEGNYRVLRKNIGCETPCYRLNCADNRCMKAVTVEDVIDKIKEFI